MSQQFSTGNFGAEVLQSKVPVLVDFTASWCPPCRLLAPVIEELSLEAAGRFNVGKVDAESDPDLAVRYKVSMLPTVLIFQHGDVVKTLVGVQRKETLLNALQAAADDESTASVALAVGNPQAVV